MWDGGYQLDPTVGRKVIRSTSLWEAMLPALPNCETQGYQLVLTVRGKVIRSTSLLEAM